MLEAEAPKVAMRFVVEGPPVGALWRRAFARAALAPLVVLGPLVALAPTADHRFNIYWHGGLFRDDPLRIVPHTLDSLPSYLRMGNFRPLGRMLEKLLDLIAYVLGDVFGIPANIAFRLVSFVAAALLAVVAMLLAESVVARGRMFRRPPSTLAAVVPFAVAGGLVAAGRASPVVLFAGLYLSSAALVLAVPLLLCRIHPQRPVRLWWIGPVVVAGAALASFNEVAYLALPLATVAVAARGRWVLALTGRKFWLAAPMRVLGLLWLGFLPVFGAVRVVINQYCAVRACYSGSDVSAGPAVFAALPSRALGWLPPLMWGEAAGGGRTSGFVFVLATVALLVLAVLAIRDLGRMSIVDRPAALVLVLVAATAVLLAATMGALNGEIQRLAAHGAWGMGWRDSAVTMPAGAILLVALGHAVRPGRRALIAALVLLFTAVGTVSATANKRFRDDVMATPAARLDDRLAQAIAEFEPTAAGQIRRCALRGEFFTLFADAPFSQYRFDQSFDQAAEQKAGVPFCPHAPTAREGK
ncbi:hypothetical protein GCM10010172_64040 [Paractinoplanes ferrugineus]|uniref:Uncharacterized protein n=1 Tax=Paractinoplanes ferrugineus TaxID=113564 RepID=A0A919IV81_9ACTN|nr:hypothetical protein [Actinoplanes ferrugineus]GIE09110.1 hypothetical protein Afe05nite_09500 [Actinoplanes ferrugineus]